MASAFNEQDDQVPFFDPNKKQLQMPGQGPAPAGTAYRGPDAPTEDFTGGTGGYTGGADLPAPTRTGGEFSVPTTPAAPQAGQFANSNQGFLDWATQKFGASPTRGSGFVDLPQGQLQQVLAQYAAATGNTASFQGGPSGDRVDFGQGQQDALTSGGQIWNAQGGGGSPAPAGAGGGGGPVGDWGPGGTTPGIKPLAAQAQNPFQPVNVIQQPFQAQTPITGNAPQAQSGPGVTAQSVQGPQDFQGVQANQLDPTTGQPQSAVDVERRKKLLDMLHAPQGPVDLTDPNIQSQSVAFSSARNRAATQQRNALAERAAASGLNSGGAGSGSFDSGLNSIYESAGRDIAGNDSALIGKEVDARRTQLMQALQMANSVGAQDEANQLQTALANLDASQQTQGLNVGAQLTTQGHQLSAGIANQGANLTADTANQNNNTAIQGLNINSQIQHQGQLLNQAQGNQSAEATHQAQLLAQAQGNQSGANAANQTANDTTQIAQTGNIASGQLGLGYANLGQQGSQFEQSQAQQQSQHNDSYGLSLAQLQQQTDRDAILQALMNGGS